KASAIVFTRRPMLPKPMMPRLAPSRSPTGTPVRSVHLPERTISVSGASDFTSWSMWANAPSATAFELTPGVIATGIPRSVAASTSTSSTPTPVRAMTLRRGIDSSSAGPTRTAARTIAPSALARSSGAGLSTRSTSSPRSVSTSSFGTGPSPMTVVFSGIDGLLPGRVATGRGRGAFDLVAGLPGFGGDRTLTGVDHAIGGQRIVDIGMDGFLADMGEQELLRLDDLEVVVAHRGAGAGLEPREVAEVRTCHDAGETDMGPLVAEGQFEFVHPLEVPSQRAFGSIDLERVLRTRAHADA